MLYKQKWKSIMTFAEKVKYVRGKLYLSQMALACEVGVSFATVNRWENGRKPTWVLECKFYDYCESKGLNIRDEK